MIGIAKIISTSLDAGRRLVKILFRGKIIDGRGDIRTPVQAAPFGFDSNPTEGKRVLYAKSGRDGKYYVIGVLNTAMLAELGESRIFATDADGEFKFNIWLRNDGSALMGDSDDPDAYTNFAVLYNELKVEYDKTKNYLTTLKSASGAIATALDGLVPGTSAAFNTAMSGQVVGDFAQAKNEKVKYNT